MDQPQESMPQGTPATSGASDDVTKNKGMAIVAYFIFFLPLLTDAKNSQFAMFHANQGLLLLIASIILWFIPIIGWIVNIVVLIFWIMGIVGAAQGKMKPLPLIGGIKILR